MRIALKLVLAVALAGTFASSAVAAPTWLPAQDLSLAPASGAPASSTVASDLAGETFAAWVRTDGAHLRTQVASHGPGQPWSAASDLSELGQDSSAPSLSLSSTGFGAIAYSRSNGTHVVVEVSRRAPGGGFGLPAVISSIAVDGGPPVAAVDAAGDIVVLWEDSGDLVLHARRYDAASASWGTVANLATATADQMITALQLVISPGGVATAAWLFDSNSLPAVDTRFDVESTSSGSNGIWDSVTPNTTIPPTPMLNTGGPQLAVDAAGTVTLVWFQYVAPGASFSQGVVYESTRSSAGVWGPNTILSDPLLVSQSPIVTTTPSGTVTVAWEDQSSQTIRVVSRTPGGAFPAAGAGTIVTPADKQIDTGLHRDAASIVFPFTTLRLAASDVGGTVLTFGRSDGTYFLAQALYRPLGGSWPNPAVTLPTVLSAPGEPIGDDTSVTFDGLGNAVASWTRDTRIQAAALDVSAPAITVANVPASGVAGQPIAMSAATLDTWSALAPGQPSWSFGDTNLGAGAAVTHVYAAPGTYTVTIGASDAVGNASAPTTRQIVVSSPPVPPLAPTTIAKPKVKAVWKSNKLVGSVTLSGTVGLATTLTASLKLHTAKKVSVSVRFAATGTWTHSLKLPSGLAPGRYDVTVSGKGAQSATTSFTLAAPKSGIVKRSYASGPRRGPAVSTLGKSGELWAHFSFGTLPKKGQRITTQWILPSGRKLAANTRPRTALVEAQVKDLSGKNLPTGRWRCVIKVGGVTLVTLNVRLK